jgi:hypothetical protein
LLLVSILVHVRSQYASSPAETRTRAKRIRVNFHWTAIEERLRWHGLACTRLLLQEAGDHGSAVLLKVPIPNAVCPDDGAESLPHRLDREQFGVIALDHPAEPGHEGTLALGVLDELLVLKPDQVADPGTVLAASEVN